MLYDNYNRFYWEGGFCSNPSTYYCIDHDQVLCNSCSLEGHDKCQSNKIPDIKDVINQLDIAKSLLNLIQQNSEQFKESSIIKNFEEEYKKFNGMFTLINEKVNNLFCI